MIALFFLLLFITQVATLVFSKDLLFYEYGDV